METGQNSPPLAVGTRVDAYEVRCELNRQRAHQADDAVLSRDVVGVHRVALESERGGR